MVRRIFEEQKVIYEKFLEGEVDKTDIPYVCLILDDVIGDHALRFDEMFEIPLPLAVAIISSLPLYVPRISRVSIQRSVKMPILLRSLIRLRRDRSNRYARIMRISLPIRTSSRRSSRRIPRIFSYWSSIKPMPISLWRTYSL